MSDKAMLQTALDHTRAKFAESQKELAEARAEIEKLRGELRDKTGFDKKGGE